MPTLRISYIMNLLTYVSDGSGKPRTQDWKMFINYRQLEGYQNKTDRLCELYMNGLGN